VSRCREQDQQDDNEHINWHAERIMLGLDQMRAEEEKDREDMQVGSNARATARRGAWADARRAAGRRRTCFGPHGD
jgi:hypothetical protein